MKEVYQMTKEELFSIYPDVDGLTEEKAKQILRENGENVLEEKAKKKRIVDIFRAICGFAGCYFDCSRHHFHDFRECGKHHCNLCGNYFKCNSWNGAVFKGRKITGFLKGVIFSSCKSHS